MKENYIRKNCEKVWIEGDRERFVGRNVKIYVNPQNKDDYVVDLDSLQDY